MLLTFKQTNVYLHTSSIYILSVVGRFFQYLMNLSLILSVFLSSWEQ